jgi:hypothetical protein
MKGACQEKTMQRLFLKASEELDGDEIIENYLRAETCSLRELLCNKAPAPGVVA